MSRPRFHRLPETQQRAILNAALAEFAAHGFRDASLNRIIEAAGISKGSMYYYFDGKEDLYADVIRAQLAGLHEDGPIPVPDAPDADAFWATIEEHYLRLARSLATAPQTAALLRDWLTGGAGPASRGEQDTIEQAVLPWLLKTVAAGQRVRAVRTDLPADLLIAVTLGMGRAMDTWLVTRLPEEVDVHALMSMIRGAVSPQPDAREL